MKNISSIEKIIAELAKKDYLGANPRRSDGRPVYKTYHPYSLSAETNEARQVRDDYLHDVISEEEYKAWCLRYNLTHRND